MHKEIPVKVNAFVDEGIAPLVSALNRLEGLVTLDSCEEGPTGEAYVSFGYGEGWQELGELLENLSKRLRQLDLCCGFSLRLEWFGSNEKPRAWLLLKPEHVADVAAAI